MAAELLEPDSTANVMEYEEAAPEPDVPVGFSSTAGPAFRPLRIAIGGAVLALLASLAYMLLRRPKAPEAVPEEPKAEKLPKEIAVSFVEESSRCSG